MEENIFVANEGLAKAIAALANDQVPERMMAVLVELRLLMNAQGRVLVPVEETDETVADGEDGEAMVSPVRLIELDTGEPAAVCFTSPTEADKGEPSSMVPFPIDQFLHMVVEDELIAGLVIDPWGTSCYLPRSVLSLAFELETDGGTGNKIALDLGDITRIDIECIVNAANSSLLGGGGVDGAIHRAAGPELLAECKSLGGCPTGEARITKGYDLKADYVIHTVGPVYSGSHRDAELLASCYRNSLDLAAQHGITSIAFPAISTGIYGYPVDEAAGIALKTVATWMSDHPDYGMMVVFSCFDQATYDAYLRSAEQQDNAGEAE